MPRRLAQTIVPTAGNAIQPAPFQWVWTLLYREQIVVNVQIGDWPLESGKKQGKAMKQKPFGRRNSACASDPHAKAAPRVAHRKTETERISIIRKDLRSSSLIDMLKEMMRRS